MEDGHILIFSQCETAADLSALQYGNKTKYLAWQQALKESNSPMLETTLRNQIVMQPDSVNIAVQSNESNSANMMMVTTPNKKDTTLAYMMDSKRYYQ